MASSDENLELIQEAQLANIAGGILKPLVDKKIQTIVTLQVAAYRGQTLTHDGMVGAIGEISGLLGLLSDIETTYRRGVVAREQEFGDA